MAIPTARPTMLASASGELNTRSRPNFRCSPRVALNTPPFPGTADSASARLQSATSSPNTTIRGLLAISSARARLMADTIVIGAPSGAPGTSKRPSAGSTSGEYT